MGNIYTNFDNINSELIKNDIKLDPLFIRKVRNNYDLTEKVLKIFNSEITAIIINDSDECLFGAIYLKYKVNYWQDEYLEYEYNRQSIQYIITSMKLKNEYALSVYKSLFTSGVCIKFLIAELYKIKYLKDKYQYIINFLVKEIIRLYKIEYESERMYFKSFLILYTLTDDYDMLKQILKTLAHYPVNMFAYICIKRILELDYDDGILTVQNFYQESSLDEAFSKVDYSSQITSGNAKSVIKYVPDEILYEYLTKYNINNDITLFNKWKSEYENIKSLII